MTLSVGALSKDVVARAFKEPEAVGPLGGTMLMTATLRIPRSLC